MSGHKDEIKAIMKLLESNGSPQEVSLNDVSEEVNECSCQVDHANEHMHEPTCPIHGVVDGDHKMHHHHDMDHHHDGYKHDPDGYEGKMSKSRLYKLANYAAKLHNLLHDDENLEPWVQDKITKAEDYISTVFHYLEYEKLTESSKKKTR